MERYDVAVIGAGAAGLAAARAISGAGYRVCCIEAREQAGGRVRTVHVPDLPLPIELGAEFIHGPAASTFSIVDAAALPVAQLPDTHLWSRRGRWSVIPDFWSEIARVQKAIGSLGRDVSFEEFLRSRRRLNPRTAQLARGFVEGYHAAHADRIGAKVLASADDEQSEDQGATRQFRIASGQDALIEWLRSGIDAERAEILFGTIVHTVTWRNGEVDLECRSAVTKAERQIRARAAVITLPVGVWKAPRDQVGAIVFDPPLREKQRALDRIEPGHVVKIVFRFRQPFWDSPHFTASRTGRKKPPPLNFVHSSDRFMPTWWTAAPCRSPVLTGWAGGHAADALLAEGPSALTDRALESLSAVWSVPRNELESLLAGTFTHDWQSDPFSRGAYSYAMVGGANAAKALSRPLGGTLFFAGEATSSDQTGTVAGAIESGKRAAGELVAALARRRS